MFLILFIVYVYLFMQFVLCFVAFCITIVVSFFCFVMLFSNVICNFILGYVFSADCKVNRDRVFGDFTLSHKCKYRQIE